MQPAAVIHCLPLIFPLSRTLDVDVLKSASSKQTLVPHVSPVDEKFVYLSVFFGIEGDAGGYSQSTELIKELQL